LKGKAVEMGLASLCENDVVPLICKDARHITEKKKILAEDYHDAQTNREECIRGGGKERRIMRPAEMGSLVPERS
jgi:hypothetical protein